VVPSNVDDAMLIASAKFRQNGRFPVLSYRHEKGVSFNAIFFHIKNSNEIFFSCNLRVVYGFHRNVF